MRYFGSANKYVLKNFIFIFLFALIPSYFLTLANDIRGIGEIMKNVFAGKLDLTFGQFFDFFSLFSLRRWPAAIAAFVLTTVCAAMLLAWMEKHMRTGSRSYRVLFRGIDYNLISTFVILLVFVVTFEFWALISAGLLSILSLIITNGIAQCVVGIAATLGLYVFLTYIASLFLLWLPCRQITGYNFMDSLAYSWQISAGRRRRLFLAVLIPFLAFVLLQGGIVAVSVYFPWKFVAFLCLELVYLFMFLYFAALMYVTFFEANGEERADLVKKY